MCFLGNHSVCMWKLLFLFSPVVLCFWDRRWVVFLSAMAVQWGTAEILMNNEQNWSVSCPSQNIQLPLPDPPARSSLPLLKRPCVEMVETRDQNSLHHWVATRRTVVGGNLCPHMVLIEWEMNVFFCMLSWRSGSFLLSQENLIYLNRTKKRWNKSQDKLTSLGFLLIPI